jgi:carbon starvation protein CstA
MNLGFWYEIHVWNTTWVTMVPTAWLLVCTLTAGWQKIFYPLPVGFFAIAPIVFGTLIG